ncbi:hypothetical protein [Neobacillus sp. YIM B06451]|uniref:hypothetical protein n=1 Tax=Neobacillus sp. YIM B06451 TaxID=3070994 RepID=UPI00292E3545|nr:hypothetical protein [Neobacillus sp. YIM B06451]
MILILAAANTVQSTPWYDSKIVHTLFGALITVIVLVVNQILTEKRERIKYRQSVLSWLTLNNSSLFVLIYEYSLDENNINYEKLRSELQRVGSFIYVLPEDLKSDFQELVRIHQREPKGYDEERNKIYPLLVSVVTKLNKYGVDAFGY